ncbi:Cell wall surface anchor family protein [Bacillus thuringiensis serovar kurstaki str. HD-1]|nr:Cell wall surface anchor family protein [Bacillus thuringiensis serovar kurstaki str. HD-1]
MSFFIILAKKTPSSHAHQLKNLHYPQVSKNVILSKKLARKDDIFYESFNSR